MDTNNIHKEAMEAVLDIFFKKLDTPIDFNFDAGGKTYPLTCTDDCLVASAQRMRKAAMETLETTRAENDYHKEKAAVRLLALFEAHEALSARFAEVSHSYPEAAASLRKQIPTLETLADTGHQTWEEIKDII